MRKCILAKTQKTRQSDESSAKHRRVSNYRSQLRQKKDIRLDGSTARVGRTARRAESTSPFNGSLIWGKTKWKKYASESSGCVYHMNMTVMCYSLVVVKKGFSYGELRLLY